MLALVTATLHAGPFQDVLSATSIREARALWERDEGRFDLLLTDFSLPDGSAPNFISALLDEKPDLQVVLMSGLPENAMDLDFKSGAGVHILPKPFRPSELLSFLKALLARAVPA